MANYLLLGAGFSRNWGGWLASEAFEYLIGHPYLIDRPNIIKRLWEAQVNGGFEYALAKLQEDTTRWGVAREEFGLLHEAVEDMFSEMNAALCAGDDFDFGLTSIVGFLTRFDAIFTLNQDLLLEQHYLRDNGSIVDHSNGRWMGVELPGVQPGPGVEIDPKESAIANWYEPITEDEFFLRPTWQPLIKLHGSSNWRASQGSSLLIIGGEKGRAIGNVPLLAWYQRLFQEKLNGGAARLMIIGYGFRDQHINSVIEHAVEYCQLRIFVVGPDGADSARRVNKTDGATIYAREPLDDAFEKGLIGASRRGLSEIFGNNDIEMKKLLRFLNA